MATRPSSDRLRETLFNVLGERVRGAQFVDLFAGSGAVGIEAMSRGAAGCVFVESAPPAVRAIRGNLTALGIASGVEVQAREVVKALEAMRKVAEKLGVGSVGADLVFLDPPYEDAAAYEAALGYLGRNAAMLLREDAVVVAEHAKKKPLAARYSALERTRVLEQGDAALAFFRVAEERGIREKG